jgi:TetR/AcrR family transcriptional repressor of nem operon
MTTQAPVAIASTAERILDSAERLAQTRGFNGFSYADVALDVGVTKASLHYHFATKAALGRALIERYASRFFAGLDAIAAGEASARERLARYAAIYEQVLVRDRMCLCGMFAAEYATLPEPMQGEVRRFFDTNENWLVAVLEDGRRAGTIAFRGDAREVARVMTGALEGSMLLARSYGDPSRFASAAARLLEDLTPRG